MKIAVLIDVVGADDVGMLQAAGGASFAIETAEGRRLFRLRRRQHAGIRQRVNIRQGVAVRV